ncbi:hypothetical protein LTR53_008949 [Teratosphaeriaceae sp. CCFEE 6253]|nr:hypothetical protein LTR53_008949 [Teratosphaeriaceae sp. CCFEE 6253]
MALASSRPLEASAGTHHGGWVIIILAILLILSLFFLLIRAYVRTTYSTIAGSPDIVLAVAGLFGIVQTCLVFWQVTKGLGTSIEAVEVSDVRLLQRVSNDEAPVLVWSEKLTKGYADLVRQHHPLPGRNVARQMLRHLRVPPVDTKQRPQSRFVRGDGLVHNVAHHLDHDNRDRLRAQCSLESSRFTVYRSGRSRAVILAQGPQMLAAVQFARRTFITTLDATTEILIFSLTFYLVIGLQMPVISKSVIVMAFSLRLFVVMPMAVRLHYIRQYIHSANPTLARSNVAIWTDALLHLGLIACVSYCFKSFTAAVSTNYGSVASNLEVSDTTNHRSGYAQS